MAKKNLSEEEKLNNRMKKLHSVYELYKDSMNLTGNTIEDIHTLVVNAANTRTEIAEKIHEIRGAEYDKVAEITPLRKNTWMRFVSVAAMKMEDKLTDKQVDKFQEQFSLELYNANLSHAFLESYMSGKNVTIVSDDDDVFTPFETLESNDFEKVLEHAAQTYIYVKSTLEKRYKLYVSMAEYITNCKLISKDFRKMVDFENDKDGDKMKPSTPAKLWALYKNFDDAYRNLNDYEFEQVKSLNNEFGLNIELKKPIKVIHPWMKYTENVSEIDEENISDE